MEIRLMTEDDIEFAVSLTDSLSWGNTPEEFGEFMNFEPEGCFIAQEGTSKVGMATSINYGTLNWIGGLIILPEYRNRGIGKQLMLHLMNYLKTKGVDTIKLDADPKALTLYKRLGFKEECKSLRFAVIRKQISPKNIEMMKASHLKNVFKLDRQVFGFNRERVLRRAFQAFPHLCFVSYKKHELLGYIMARQRKNGFRIGPWICIPKYPRRTEELLKVMLSKLNSKRLSIGVLELNGDSISIIKKYKVEELRSSIRMFYGKKVTGGDVKGEFAIGQPDKG